jgi:hypothetical protein
MNEREFIELLNLYVDREIGADDALRLEAEVGANPERRRVYDQYCRMQKACSMLSSELADVDGKAAERPMIEFPAQPARRFRPAFALMAAAACLGVLAVFKYRAALPGSNAPAVAAVPVSPRTILDTVDLAIPADPMSSVFYARAPSGPAGHPEAKAFFGAIGESPTLAQLNWIGDIHLAPVFSGANAELLLAPASELRPGLSDDAASRRLSPEPSEMTAFRFQR